VIGGNTAFIQPEDTEGQSGVNRGLGFSLIHAKDREGGSSLAQTATSIDWAERALQIDRVAELRTAKPGKFLSSARRRWC
jgi:hypothetical protein